MGAKNSGRTKLHESCRRRLVPRPARPGAIAPHDCPLTAAARARWDVAAIGDGEAAPQRITLLPTRAQRGPNQHDWPNLSMTNQRRVNQWAANRPRSRN
jgi:hypothetical protein